MSSAVLGSDAIQNRILASLNASTLSRYAEFHAIQLSLHEGSVTVEFTLLGEDMRTTLQASECSILKVDETFHLNVRAVLVSKEWLQNLAEDHAVGRLIPIPEHLQDWAGRLITLGIIPS